MLQEEYKPKAKLAVYDLSMTQASQQVMTSYCWISSLRIKLPRGDGSHPLELAYQSAR